MYIAAFNGHLNVVKFLLNQDAMVDARIVGNTPLDEICGQKKLPRPLIKAIITELLAHKANVNALHYYSKNTPLYRAICALNDETIVRQLILAGADVTIAGKDGKTALDMIKTPSMLKTYEEACAINEQAFQHLDILEIISHTEMLQNPHIPVKYLAQLIIDYAVPYYKTHDDNQPAYDILNKRIAQQWIQIKKALHHKDIIASKEQSRICLLS